jgi:hypothetical protein
MEGSPLSWPICPPGIDRNGYFQQKIESCLESLTQILPLCRLTEQLELFNWRKQHQTHLVNCEWIKIEPLNDREVFVHLRSTQVLTVLPDINTVKGQYIMRGISKMFTGFKLLFDKFGPFEVTPVMVAFDSFYDPLVWMNANFSKNEYKRVLISEEQFARSILEIILSHA